MKKIFSLVLGAAILFGTASVMAQQEVNEWVQGEEVYQTADEAAELFGPFSSKSGTCGENITWTLDYKGVLTISGTGDMADYAYDTSLDIKSTRPEDWSDATSLVIEEGVTSIGDYAFYGCEKLSQITFPESLISIGHSSYTGCDGVEEILLPGGLLSIESSAFNDCVALRKIVIPDTVTAIGAYAFASCDVLAEVTIGKSVDSIGARAFANCGALTTVNYNASQCSSIDVDNGLVFEYSTAFTTLNIGEAVKSIPRRAFYKCEGLAEIVIPDNVETIGYEAFAYCTGITEVTIGKGVISVNDYAFRGCSGLTTVNYNAVECEEMGSYDHAVFRSCTALTQVNIGNEVKALPSDFLNSCTGLTEIVIPNGVEKIGSAAFYACMGLTEVIIPESVTEMEAYPFKDCTALTTVNFNATACEKMGESDFPPFMGCSALMTINIGENVTKIPSYAFKNCGGVSEISIPPSVTEIGSETLYGTAVYNNPNNWTDGVLYIDNYLIEVQNSQSGSFVIGETVKAVAESAFKDCTELTSVIILNDMTDIPAKLFSGCVGLTEVVIPGAVKNIEKDAFWSCSALTDVYYSGSKEEWENITVGFGNNNVLKATVNYTPFYMQWDPDGNILNILGVAGTYHIIFSNANDTVVTEVSFDAKKIEEFSLPEGMSTSGLKIFLWESLESLVPLTKARTIN